MYNNVEKRINGDCSLRKLKGGNSYVMVMDFIGCYWSHLNLCSCFVLIH